MSRWEDRFGSAYAVPAEVLALVEGGEAEDTSWGNDSCPSFGRFDATGDRGARLFVDHPDPREREDAPPTKRFFVLTTVDGMDDSVGSTDDAAEAVAMYRAAVARVLGGAA